MCNFLFFFNDTATTEIYTLSLHDALPICQREVPVFNELQRLEPSAFQTFVVFITCANAQDLQELLGTEAPGIGYAEDWTADRKSTRLNSSHSQISYAVFCLKKKNKHATTL